jgi:hypothetical protein
LAFSGILQVNAQTLDVSITVSSLSPPRVRVEGTRSIGAKEWSFLNVYGSVIGLGERVEGLTFENSEGVVVSSRKMAPGLFESEREAFKFSYELRLDPPAKAGDAAHVSWLDAERGMLMLADLLRDSRAMPSSASGCR